MPKNQFDQNYQPAVRTPRSRGWRTRILEAFEADGKTEDDFIKYICARAFNPDDPLASQLIKEVIQRLDPSPKQTLPVIKFHFPSDGTPVEKIESVISAVSTGEMSADIAQVLVNMVKTAVDIEEVTELAARLERLEQLLAKASA
ncbi:hypothetical protein UFOVP150_79 [uncultured Caudovirales phage]|uniref:Coil containing protein n=1 Tax=uncultured Caudovirales phage TaxID=2100421 RepID=A0A6J7W8A3_9CAUD|nr:hypothetical protein UFOVP150_79 [uncultured Caudovirales phage]